MDREVLGDSISLSDSMINAEKRKTKERQIQTLFRILMSQIRAIQAEIRLLNKQYKTTEDNMSVTEDRLREVQKQTAEIEIPEPPPLPRPDPEPIPEPEPVSEPPRSTNTGVEFSILGLATNKKEVVVVVDMSGSMRSHRDNVERALNEILDVLKPDNRFAIIGYRGGPTYDDFPRGGTFTRADANSVSQARRFVDGLSRRFGGGTPTQSAMVRALNMRFKTVVILLGGRDEEARLKRD